MSNTAQLAENTAVEPFLIGDGMTGGYGTGADILHDCTVAVNPGEIAVIVGPNGAGKIDGDEGGVWNAEPARRGGAESGVRISRT